MTNEEYKIISEAIEKCKCDIEKSFDQFMQKMKLEIESYPSKFISEQEAETHESNIENTH